MLIWWGRGGVFRKATNTIVWGVAGLAVFRTLMVLGLGCKARRAWDFGPRI